MKKQLIIGLLAGVSFGAFAQEGKLVSTWNALESYKRGDGEQNLESALPYINEAIENESTMNNTKHGGIALKCISLSPQRKI